MSNDIAAYAVIGCLIFTALMAIIAIRGKLARERASKATSEVVETWMRNQDYIPEHFNFFYGTAIALKQGDNKLLLHHDGKSKLYALSDLLAFKAHESVERTRPLGAAPGVVEASRNTRRFNLDLTLRNTRAPIRILLANKELLLAWQQRLEALIATQKHMA